MANVLNKTTNEYLFSVNTPDFDPAQWLINPDLSAVAGFDPKYWVITGNVVTLAGPAARQVIDDNIFIALINALSVSSDTYGDGSDGPLVIAADQPLTQDIYPTILTINAGTKLTQNGFKIIAQFGIVNNGTLDISGTDATTGAPGAGASSGTLGGGTAGAAGGLLAGLAALDVFGANQVGFGGAGGKGGNGTSGQGGIGGRTRLGTMAQARVRPRRLLSVLFGGDFDAVNGFVQFAGGGGGGAGAGDGLNAGGHGGGGAGFGLIAAPYIFNGPTGTINGKGGAGASPTAGNTGGGSGGGGALLAVVSAQTRNRGTFSVAGGLGAAGLGTGTAGANGNNGRMLAVNAPINS